MNDISNHVEMRRYILSPNFTDVVKVRYLRNFDKEFVLKLSLENVALQNAHKNSSFLQSY